MNTVILIAIIFLGINVVRFGFSALVLLFTGKANGKEFHPFAIVFNLFETAAIIYAYVKLVMHYYSN